MADIIRVSIIGSNGKMGEMVKQEIERTTDMKVVEGIYKDPERGRVIWVDEDKKAIRGPFVIIDVSSPDALENSLKDAQDLRCPLIIGTTGYSEEQKEKIRLASKHIPIMMSPNFSLGVAFFIEAILTIVRRYKDLGIQIGVKITEIHHTRKRDVSGTAIRIKGRILSVLGEEIDIPIESIRKGDVVGTHIVEITAGDVVHSLSNAVGNRTEFAVGIVEAVRCMAEINMPVGLYDMDVLIR